MKCDLCGEEGAVAVTDSENLHDGNYCEDCLSGKLPAKEVREIFGRIELTERVD